jgi:PQQ-dependent catabolism-associated CXXCW motif protein
VNRFLLLWLLFIPLVSSAYPPASLFDTDGYRIDQFRGPVADVVPGARTLTTPQVQALIARGGVALLDVLPAPPRPAGLDAGAPWMPPPHANIPGSVWLPNVGYGQLSAELAAHLWYQVQRLTSGDPAHPILVYCLKDCWMSWNVAKRLAAAGYTAVYWYPDGIDGWKAAGLSLEECPPTNPGSH